MAFPIDNSVAVITGAAGGIGAAVAEQLARHGAHLALVDRDGAKLEATARGLSTPGRRLSLYEEDLADPDAVARLHARVTVEHGRTSLLVNNAGVAMAGRFADMTDDDFAWLMAINFHAHVRMTRAFLPLLRQEKEARIVNVSSLFGLVGSAGQTAYCASKFALRGFSEALGIELATGGSTVGVTTVCPGGVKTGIAAAARIVGQEDQADELEEKREKFQQHLKLSPEAAAIQIVKAVKKRRRQVLVGKDARLLSALQRLFPGGYQRLMERL
jgi:short-subunit dehydrogenase